MSLLVTKDLVMTCFKASRLPFAATLAALGLAVSLSAHAQPMGGMGMPADAMVGHPHMSNGSKQHTHMAQSWEARQKELKAKLKLSSTQEDAWNIFAQAMKPSSKPPLAALDREALAKLSTPERIDKMSAFHEAHHAEMQSHMKQRNDGAKQFYGQLTAEQQKVFDAETLPRAPHPMGRMGQGPAGNAN
jgi:Spy/CpxP family protein refolding chaperone